MKSRSQRSYLVKYPVNGAVLGIVSYYRIPDGWLFISHTSSRSNSRKYHETADGALPTWARRMGCVLEPVQ